MAPLCPNVDAHKVLRPITVAGHVSTSKDTRETRPPAAMALQRHRTPLSFGGFTEADGHRGDQGHKNPLHVH
ncbi:hypothetical protein V2J23_18390, partial [Geobacillus thermoleovorans]|uniref:hypothetical protein n=1 Tax=Geobacillus thermoleovorans TaxID=33941 RepID=UPI00345C0F4A